MIDILQISTNGGGVPQPLMQRVVNAEYQIRNALGEDYARFDDYTMFVQPLSDPDPLSELGADETMVRASPCFAVGIVPQDQLPLQDGETMRVDTGVFVTAATRFVLMWFPPDDPTHFYTKPFEVRDGHWLTPPAKRRNNNEDTFLSVLFSYLFTSVDEREQLREEEQARKATMRKLGLAPDAED